MEVRIILKRTVVKKCAVIKDIKFYIKPEERTAYFVINGDFTGKVDF